MSSLHETVAWGIVCAAIVAIIGLAASCESTRSKAQFEAQKRGNCICE